MPIVPQEVPVAKPIAAPMMKMMAGRKFFREPALARAALTESADSRAYLVKELRVQARVRMRIGDTIWMKPLGTDSKLLSKPMVLRHQK